MLPFKYINYTFTPIENAMALVYHLFSIAALAWSMLRQNASFGDLPS